VTDREIEQAEKVAVLELEVRLLRENLQNITNKLDELLALRQKGLGAFWLASTLLGTGIVGAVVAIINYWRS